MTYQEAIDWAYSKYTDSEIDPFIEKLSLATDVPEILELISNEYQVYGEPDINFLVGEVSHLYKSGKLSLYEAIHKVLFRLDVELSEGDSQNMYIAEDLFGWHKTPDAEAIKYVDPIFNKYAPYYQSAISKLSA